MWPMRRLFLRTEKELVANEILGIPYLIHLLKNQRSEIMEVRAKIYEKGRIATKEKEKESTAGQGKEKNHRKEVEFATRRSLQAHAGDCTGDMEKE